LESFCESDCKTMEFKEIVIERISVGFLYLYIFRLSKSRRCNNISNTTIVSFKTKTIIYFMSFVGIFKGILAFKIESLFFKCTDKNFIKFIILS